MQQQAYDFSLFTPDEEPATKKVPLRSVRGGKPKQTKLKKAAVGFWNVFGCAVFLALTVLLIQSKVTLTELTAQEQSVHNQLTDAQSTYNYLSSELNSRTNMASVEDIANRLGLMKIDDSQITYVRLEDSSVLSAAESPVKHWTDWMKAGVLSLMETLDP
jgi:cell division protein FtsL